MKFIRIGPHDSNLFDTLVKNEGAFVKFYSPRCFHCNQMAPAWDALEDPTKRGIQRHANIIEVHNNAVGKIASNCARNINGYPTIMEVKPGGYPGREYHGPRTTESMLRTKVSRRTKASRPTKRSLNKQ